MVELFKIRASEVGLIMPEPKSKTETLSQGAKTLLENKAKQLIYGFDMFRGNKYTEKGNLVENDSIELYNRLFFTNYRKHEGRVVKGYLTGECDIDTGDIIIDIKSSWNLSTFPVTEKEAVNAQYFAQLQAYMYLYERDHSKLAYCLVNTPDHLIGRDAPEDHYFDGIPDNMRVTVVDIPRNDEYIERMLDKVEKSAVYFTQIYKSIIEMHEQY